MRKPLLLAGLAGVLLLPARAFAGVTITVQRGAGQLGTMYVEGDRMRMDAPERNERATAIIMDGPTKRILMIDDRNKTYIEMTEEDRKRMRAQADAMRAQMQERMKNMPPEQRKKMEELMGPGAGTGDHKPHDWKFASMGQKKTVNGFACEMYRVSEDGRVREEDCISPWSAGLIKKSDFAGVAKLGEEMFEGMSGGAGGERGHGAGVFARIDKAPGIPISRLTIQPDGKPGDEEQIKSIKRGAIAASLFAVPAGFAKKELPMGMGMGPGGRPHGPQP
jgi:hypothetical protein